MPLLVTSHSKPSWTPLASSASGFRVVTGLHISGHRPVTRPLDGRAVEQVIAVRAGQLADERQVAALGAADHRTGADSQDAARLGGGDRLGGRRAALAH